MLLIREETTDIQYVTEARGEDGKKSLYIEGVFMQYDTPNRNGRVYPRHVMEQELSRYIKDVVETKRAYGELNHPEGPSINLDRVCHMFESLEIQPKGLVVGKARVAESLPCGQMVKGLIEMGANLGVSTRGLGSLKEGRSGLMEVQGDFRLVTAGDVVADPSAPSAFVKGILEGVEFSFDERTGEYIANARKEMHKMNKRQLEESALAYFENFLKKI